MTRTAAADIIAGLEPPPVTVTVTPAVQVYRDRACGWAAHAAVTINFSASAQPGRPGNRQRSGQATFCRGDDNFHSCLRPGGPGQRPKL